MATPSFHSFHLNTQTILLRDPADSPCEIFLPYPDTYLCKKHCSWLINHSPTVPPLTNSPAEVGLLENYHIDRYRLTWWPQPQPPWWELTFQCDHTGIKNVQWAERARRGFCHGMWKQSQKLNPTQLSGAYFDPKLNGISHCRSKSSALLPDISKIFYLLFSHKFRFLKHASSHGLCIVWCKCSHHAEKEPHDPHCYKTRLYWPPLVMCFLTISLPIVALFGHGHMEAAFTLRCRSGCFFAISLTF